MNSSAKAILVVSAVGSCVLMTGCGTVSNLKPTAAGGPTDMRQYSRVIVRDFGETVSAKAKAEDKVRREAEAKAAGRRFAEKIAAELRIAGTFEEVARDGTPAPATLTVGGTITRAVEGSKAARLLIGLGAGSSYFDATVEVRDSVTTNLLGTLVVDKNSWGGGGWLAMEQTMETFMDEAARKVAGELSAAKLQGAFLPEPSRAPPTPSRR
jgi:hypothetical protein